jgi:hypothetical protein
MHTIIGAFAFVGWTLQYEQITARTVLDIVFLAQRSALTLAWQYNNNNSMSEWMEQRIFCWYASSGSIISEGQMRAVRVGFGSMNIVDLRRIYSKKHLQKFRLTSKSKLKRRVGVWFHQTHLFAKMRVVWYKNKCKVLRKIGKSVISKAHRLRYDFENTLYILWGHNDDRIRIR